MKKREQKRIQEINVLKQVVDRNKLKNSGDSIDKMVELLKSKNINIDFMGSKK